MKCSEIIERLENLSPTSFAENWDNIGLLAGRRDKEVKCIYIALDATDEVIEDAIRQGADMLITHHPLIFTKLNRIDTDHFIGRRLFKLIQNDISYYAMHTNFDVMGMADAAADELALQDRQVLELTYEDDISKEGIGRFGRLREQMSLLTCAEFVKKVFQLESVRVWGKENKIIEKVALAPGSGGSCIRHALALGADVLVTGDIDHHEGIDALAQGLAIIDAGHYGIEKIFIPYMYDFFKREMPELEVYKEIPENPFWVLVD